jgi:hypothetical protein
MQKNKGGPLLQCHINRDDLDFTLVFFCAVDEFFRIQVINFLLAGQEGAGNTQAT